MSQSSEQLYADHAYSKKGIDVIVGGFPRSTDEAKIRKLFSNCGKIVEVRMLKDKKGNSKGFWSVRFATIEAAARAVTLLNEKNIGVLPSSEQDTLFIGNLNKAWTANEFQQSVLQVFPDIESIDLALIKDIPFGQKQRNHGFAFVKFSSHAAASRALRVGSQPDFRLGNLHPVVQLAETKPEVDKKELAEVKVASVRNLPTDAEENYLSQLFDPYGKVEKVVVSKKGTSSVGFVHFTKRLDLDRAVNELNGKIVGGPRGGQACVLQVEVARPLDKNKKRVRQNSGNNSTHNNSKILKSNIHTSHIFRESEPVDPYEDAVIALPLAVKDRLLRILLLGIATRFDITVYSLRSLKELPEPIAISVLDQFMISGPASQNKSAYLAAMISKHQLHLAPGQSLVSLLRVFEDKPRNEHNFSHHLSSSPAAGSFASHAVSAADRIGLRPEERHISPPQAPTSSYGRLGPSLSSDSRRRAIAGQQAPAARPQMRFDSFTGEPYKFDPFTGEPIIHPGSCQRQV